MHITLPNSTDEAWIHGGRYGIVIGADTPDISTLGHNTDYPGDTETVGIEVPLRADADFDYTVLHEGPCSDDEVGWEGEKYGEASIL
ncbi:hypothetical protein IMZ48_45790 [Candidatus Bathyarchaeota archaeon]|nr:hypothetical protein [Candidatus Bathyarchaeota archaeon]